MLLTLGATAQDTSHRVTETSGSVRTENGVKIEKVAEGFGFPEGPVWHPDGFLLFSDIHAGIIYRLLPEGGAEPWITLDPPGSTNGLQLSYDGKKIYACGHGKLQFLEIDAQTREIRVLSANHQGNAYNNVNDVAVTRSGHVYFTDPKWGKKPGNVQGVYQVSPQDGTTTLAVELDQQPNGIVVSPDQQWIYVARSGAGEIRRYRLNPDGGLTDGETWATLDEGATPDGMTVDKNGNVYVAQASDGKVTVLTPDGKKTRQIDVFNRMCTNVEFEKPAPGGIGEGRVLYATGGGSGKDKKTGAVYRLTLPVED